METLSPWNRFGLVDEMTVREYLCPSCANLFAVEVRKVGDAPLMDTAMAPLRPNHPTRDAAE